MKVFAQIVSMAVCLLGLGTLGCQHTAPTQGGGFGQPGANKITVFVGGDVVKPGRYYFTNSVVLAEVPALVGGWLRCSTCGRTPSRVTVTRGAEDRKYSLAGKHDKEIGALRLQEGDAINYGTFHL